MTWLTKHDLYSACLVDRQFNDAASIALYAEISWTRSCKKILGQTTVITSPPVAMAFERRPFLKNYTKVLRIIASATEYTSFPTMPKLTSVIFIQCSRCRASWRKGAEVFAVLRALDLSPNISSIELPPIQEISLRNELKYSQNLNTLRLHGFWPARELESLLQISSTPLITLDVEIDPDTPGISQNLSRLQTLTVRNAYEYKHLVCTIRSIISLVHLSIYYDCRFQTSASDWDEDIPYCHLPELKSLKIVHKRLECSGIPALKGVLACLTSSSHRLENICISKESFPYNAIRGEYLVQLVIKRHRKSLKKLEIPSLSISEETITCLIKDCPNLKYLHMNCRERHMLLLGQIFHRQSHIQTLKITAECTTSTKFLELAAARLFVMSPALQEVAVSIHLNGLGDITWKRYWEYDEQLGAAVQILATPQL